MEKFLDVLRSYLKSKNSVNKILNLARLTHESFSVVKVYIHIYIFFQLNNDVFPSRINKKIKIFYKTLFSPAMSHETFRNDTTDTI